MNCFRCDRDILILAPLTDYERQAYVKLQMVVRFCIACGLEQNHMDRDEPLSPAEAAKLAPRRAWTE